MALSTWRDMELVNSSGSGRGANVLSLQVRDGHTTTLTIELYDIPTGVQQATDPYCVTTIALPWRSALEWQTVSEQRTIAQDHGEASCQITYTVHGSIP